MTQEKMYTLVLTGNQLDVIYDALEELSYSNDVEELVETISNLQHMIHESTKE